MCGPVPQGHSCRPLCHLTQQNRDERLSCLRAAPHLLPHGRPLLLLSHMGRVTGALGQQQVVWQLQGEAVVQQGQLPGKARSSTLRLRLAVVLLLLLTAARPVSE